MRYAIVFLLAMASAFARTSATGFCSKGGQVVVTPGSANSTTQVMRSYPSCTVTVLTSMGGMATLFADNAGTPLANPFTANTIGQWTFYADPDEYSITLSGALINAPFTLQMYVSAGSGSSPSGITSLNGLTGATQTFATGTTGTDFGIVSAGTTHTFNLPSSSAANRGLLTSADWTAFNAKQGALTFTAPLVNTAGTVALTLPMTIGQGGTGQITQTAAFTALSPQTTKGDLIGFTTTPIRFGVGADGTVLTAASGQASGWQWLAVTPAAGATNSVQKNGGAGVLAASSITDDGTTVTTPEPVTMNKASADLFGTVLTLQKRGTTGDATAAVGTGAALGNIAPSGWNGSAYTSTGGADFAPVANENWTTMANGTRWQLATVPNGTAVAQWSWRVNHNGSITHFPTAVLQWPSSGDANSTGNVDTGLARNGVGIAEVNNGTAGTIRDLKTRHDFCGGTAPSITTHFNTSGDSIAGGDACGAVTVGSGVATNTGVVTFGTAYSTAPICIAENETTLSQGVQAVATTTTLTLNGFLYSSGAAQNFTNGVILKYQCRTY